MKRILMLAALFAGLAVSCAPTLKQAETFVAPVAIVLHLDGPDLVIPNAGGPLLDGWEVTLDVSTDYQTDAQGLAWCPDAKPIDFTGGPVKRPLLTSPKYPAFNRIHCDMPGLAASAQRRIVTASGRVLASQGFAYRAATGAVPIPLTLP